MARAPRSAPGRERILDRALEVFLARGFVGTTTDQLAAAAAVSKQTLYKEFGDKEGVFVALIEHACASVEDPFAPLRGDMQEVRSAQQGIALLAERFAGSILSPRVQRLRRLVIAEAVRFPHLGRLYWEGGFAPTLESVAACLEVLDHRGLLAIPDPSAAAQHFAGLLLWIPGNRTMFLVEEPGDPAGLRAEIDAGCAAFLRAYAPSEPAAR